MAEVKLLTHTPSPEQVVAAAARLCYSARDIDSVFRTMEGEDSHQTMIEKIMDLGHFSVLEHVSFSFGIDGASRSASHQLVRHRVASFSQQSQRYVKSSSPSYVIPQSVVDAGQEQRFCEAMEGAWAYYRAMLNAGVPAEDARFVLPNAAQTKMVTTMNARELHHFFSLRCCDRAQWEIRDIANEMLRQCREVAPTLFTKAGPGCVRNDCPEGEMGCGKEAFYGATANNSA